MGPESVLTRRALLSGGALFSLASLLAACGQQANNEAAAAASTAPSETASASASATEASSGSATPSPVITRGYSGGSKAPDGEYRKADGYGPAQNVPKPRNEPAQYPENEDGMQSMMNNWLDAHNYGMQTGDCSYARMYMGKIHRNTSSTTTLRGCISAVAGSSKEPMVISRKVLLLSTRRLKNIHW